tara:strand:+ start:99 stop:284 length:186 start_codon:yes stop_codon:yes gene_type:complete
MKDIVTKISEYEYGNLNFQETCELFQLLLDTGMIHALQGSYQRVAEDLLEGEFITLPAGEK